MTFISGDVNDIIYDGLITCSECGHPVVFILNDLITYNSANTAQNVNYVYSDMFRLA